MTTDAFVGNVRLLVGDAASPENFVAYCEVTSISGLGQKNDQVEATTFCSNGSKEFIAGLAEGNEVTIEANYVAPSSTSYAQQQALIAAVKAKLTNNFQLFVVEDSPTEVTIEFSLAMLSWDLAPSISDKNKITFTGKITGDVVIA